jgi:hypothetical protein
MSARFLAALLATAIAWVSLFSFEPGQQALGHPEHVSMSDRSHDCSGSVFDHHLDDLPLQSLDSAVDLPDHQPIGHTATIPSIPATVFAQSGGSRFLTVFLEGLLRPPISTTPRAGVSRNWL